MFANSVEPRVAPASTTRRSPGHSSRALWKRPCPSTLRRASPLEDRHPCPRPPPTPHLPPATPAGTLGNGRVHQHSAAHRPWKTGPPAPAPPPPPKHVCELLVI